jgi:hypothetical protein
MEGFIMKIINSVGCMLLTMGLYAVPVNAIGWGQLFKGAVRFSVKTRPRVAVTATTGSWFSYYAMLGKDKRNHVSRITADGFTNRLLQLKNLCYGTATLAQGLGEKIGKKVAKN